MDEVHLGPETLGAGVTPAQGSVKPTVGFTSNKVIFSLPLDPQRQRRHGALLLLPLAALHYPSRPCLRDHLQHRRLEQRLRRLHHIDHCADTFPDLRIIVGDCEHLADQRIDYATYHLTLAFGAWDSEIRAGRESPRLGLEARLRREELSRQFGVADAV